MTTETKPQVHRRMTIDYALITRLNNQGANSISLNNFASSVKNLAAALKVAQDALLFQRLPNTKPDVTEVSSFPTSLISIDDWMMSSIHSDPEGTNPTNKNSLIDESPFLFCYNHPIYIPDEVTTALAYGQSSETEGKLKTDDNLSSHLLQMVAIAITFNLGIAFQSMAAPAETPVSKKLTSDSIMKRSLKLFQQSYHLCRVTYEDCDIAQVDTSSTALFSLAALNNVAVVYKLLGETERASSCFRDLLSALMMCIVFEADSNKASQYSAFFQNTAQLSYPDCSVCAGSA